MHRALRQPASSLSCVGRPAQDIAALEGGKNHVFTGNIAAPGQHTIHALSKGCAGALAYLDLVSGEGAWIWWLVPDLCLRRA